MAEPVAFHDFSRDYLPVTFYGFREEDDVLVWEETITDAGALRIPPLGHEHGPVWILVETATGVVQEAHPFVIVDFLPEDWAAKPGG